ncbi:MAG: VWA domain-containing protein [Acidobacteriia bacterium]|nr:VWA domain-containing protein [Terriglobia bacterium]
MMLARAILSTALLCVPGGIAQAQGPPQSPQQQPQPQQPVFRAQTNLVLVPALVKNQNDEIVYGLQAKDFIIEDDGVEQTVNMDEAADVVPVSLVVAIQLGRSAKAELRRIRALGTMLGPILSQGRNRAAIVTFDSEVVLARGFTTDGELVASDLQKLRAGNKGAAILNAVRYSVSLLKNEPKERQRVLLLISETRDHSKIANLDDAVQAIGDSNTVVYSLAFAPWLSSTLDALRGNYDDSDVAGTAGGVRRGPLLAMAAQTIRTNTPKTIAAMTGGEYELFKSERGFEARMTDFTNHLHNRYLLSFQPKSPHPGLHEVRVRLRSGNDIVILARTRYWATARESAPE